MQLKVRPSMAGFTNRNFSGGKPKKTRSWRGSAAFTLVEVLIAAMIVGLVFGGVINCYIQTGTRIEWTGYSLAAQSLATEGLEQARSGNWDPAQVNNPVNNLTNMALQAGSYDIPSRTYTGYSVSTLDIPFSGTNVVAATNFVTVQLIYVNGDPKVQMQFIEVDTVWPFYYRKTTQYFTNTASTMVAPDDRQI